MSMSIVDVLSEHVMMFTIVTNLAFFVDIMYSCTRYVYDLKDVHTVPLHLHVLSRLVKQFDVYYLVSQSIERICTLYIYLCFDKKIMPYLAVIAERRALPSTYLTVTVSLSFVNVALTEYATIRKYFTGPRATIS
jgi:hypothetical protein